jgi:selenocysteine lyase/cysteine desulfurase
MNTADLLIPNQRDQFNIPEDVAYLNCAYLSPLMKSVVAAGEEAVRRKRHPWETTPPDFFTLPDRGRELFAQIIGAGRDDIAIVPAISYGMAIAALNINVAQGQEILILADQFPSNVYPWGEKARVSGGRVVTVPRPAPIARGRAQEDWTPSILKAIGPQTAIVSLPHCHWTDGSLIDLVAVGEKARREGAALVLDVAQSAGVLPIDVKAIQPDYLVAVTYKWLLGPYSLGFAYIAPHRQDGRPVEQTWAGREGAEDFARLVDYQDEWAPAVQRMDMGERAQFQLMPMAIAAMEQILDWGVGNIALTLAEKTRVIAKRAAALGLESVPVDRRAGHMIGLNFPGGVPAQLLDRLIEQKIYVSARGDSMRVTPHLYNSDHDVDRFIAALAAALR